MGGFAYMARSVAGTDANLPASWPYGWQYPADAKNTAFPTTPISGGFIDGIPWPPNWPPAVVANLQVNVDAPATIQIGTHSAIIVAYLTIAGLTTGTSIYLNHMLQVTSSEVGATRKLKKSGGAAYTDSIAYKVTNYAGAFYGFSQTIDFDPTNWTVADNIDIQVKLITAFANPTGTDQWQVAY